MHVMTFYLSILWVAILFALTIYLVLRAKTIQARLLALDTLTLILIAFLILFVHANRSYYYLDAVLILALLTFISTLAAAWYYGARSISQ